MTKMNGTIAGLYCPCNVVVVVVVVAANVSSVMLAAASSSFVSLQSMAAVSLSALRRPNTVGASIIRIGFRGIFDYDYNKETPNIV